MANAPIKDFREAVGKIENLHGNMAVLSRLGPLLKDPNSDIDDASRLIQSDSALAASIIRISNSAFYGGSSQVRDVHSALGKVGFNEALRLVGMALSKQVFMRDLTTYGISADCYWCQSYFLGLFLEETAQRLGNDVDDAYMVGLLHAIGKVVLNELIDPAEVEIYWDATYSSEEWEDIMFGIHYNEAGAILLEKWKFPDSIHRRVEKQLASEAIETDSILACLAFARDILMLNAYDFSAREWTLPEAHPFYEENEPETVASEIRRCRSGLEKVRATLKGAAQL